jgi:hypothetical protein
MTWPDGMAFVAGPNGPELVPLESLFPDKPCHICGILVPIILCHPSMKWEDAIPTCIVCARWMRELQFRYNDSLWVGTWA